MYLHNDTVSDSSSVILNSRRMQRDAHELCSSFLWQLSGRLPSHHFCHLSVLLKINRLRRDQCLRGAAACSIKMTVRKRKRCYPADRMRHRLLELNRQIFLTSRPVRPGVLKTSFSHTVSIFFSLVQKCSTYETGLQTASVFNSVRSW